MTEEELRLLAEKLQAQDGDLALLVASSRQTAIKVLGELRSNFIAEKIKAGKINKSCRAFGWITDFPLFE